MKTYRPRDLSISAVQFTGTNFDEIQKFADDIKPGLGDSLSYSQTATGEIWMNTRAPHSVLKAKQWDWIVLDEKTMRFYPMDHLVFMTTYEEAPIAEEPAQTVE